MKKILFKMMMLSCMVLTAFTSMAQGSFAYQAVIRDSKGQLVCDKTVGMRFTLSYDSKDYYQETQSTKTNAYGNVSVMVGSGTVVSGTFMSVPWNTMKIMMKVEVSVDNSDYINLGAIQIQPAPYAMYAASFNTELQAADGAAEDVPLFSVKNSDGELVFAIYPSGVRVYVDGDESKSMRSGFAVSKRHAATKDGDDEEIFAVGNFGTQVYVDDDESKSMRSGFAVSGRHAATKDGETNDYFSVNAEGTQVYIDDDESKSMRSGFAVSGRHAATKDGETNEYLSVNAEGTQVYVDDDESKSMRSGFAVSGRHAATKDGNSDDLFSVSGSDVSIAASSFNVSDKESDKVVFAVNNSKVNVNADMLMTGGIGNVADIDVPQTGKQLTLYMQKNNDAGYYELYRSLADESDSLTVDDGSRVGLYMLKLCGIGPDGQLLESFNDNDGGVEYLCFDKFGKLTQKSTGAEVMLFVSDNFLEAYLPNVTEDSKFCLLAINEKRVGDAMTFDTTRIDCQLKIAQQQQNANTTTSYVTPAKILYYRVDIKDGKVSSDSYKFEYYNMGGYEYEVYNVYNEETKEDITVYEVYVNGESNSKKNCYVCMYYNDEWVIDTVADEIPYYSGSPCYSLENFSKKMGVTQLELVTPGDKTQTYQGKDDGGDTCTISLYNGYVIKYEVKINGIDTSIYWRDESNSSMEGYDFEGGLDSDLLKQLKIGDSGDAFAATD